MQQPSDQDKIYTATEVGTILESLRTDISVIAEGQIALREDVSILKQDVKEFKADMTVVKDVLRITMPRIDRLEAKVFG